VVNILYQDPTLCVCVKPAGVLSTDEPGGMPSLVRETLGGGCVRTVHRLDRVVGGLMVLARSPQAASALSEQVRDRRFGKVYLAVIHGAPDQDEGTFTDLLLRDPAERKTYIVHHLEKGVQEAVLDYRVLGRAGGLSLARIVLQTGRTHQIRAQFSGRGLPLVGDRKYSTLDDGCGTALWSYELSFVHPDSGKPLTFRCPPPAQAPWVEFSEILARLDR